MYELLGKLYRIFLEKSYEWRRTSFGSSLATPLRWTWDALYKGILHLKLDSFSSSDTILVSGARRSGTTWLAELLCSSPDYCMIFEPIVLWRKYGLVPLGGCADYISPESEWLRGKELFDKLFEGRSVHPHAFIHNSPAELIRCNSLLIKSVNTNMLIPWLSANFQIRGIVLIIRHPCAVVASLKKHLPKPLHQVSLTHQRYVKENLPHLTNYISGLKTQEEILTVGWCCDHHSFLKHRQSYSWIQVPYEKLVLDGKNELKFIFSALNLYGFDKAFNQLRIRSLSSHSWSADHKRETAEKRLSKWRSTLDKEEVKRVLSVIEVFGIIGYNDDIIPDFDNIGVAT